MGSEMCIRDRCTPSGGGVRRSGLLTACITDPGFTVNVTLTLPAQVPPRWRTPRRTSKPTPTRASATLYDVVRDRAAGSRAGASRRALAFMTSVHHPLAP